MLRTSMLTALLVGTVLVAINQGTAIARDGLTGDIAWRVALTYLVPFCVATWGSLAGSRRRSPAPLLSHAEGAPPESRR